MSKKPGRIHRRLYLMFWIVLSVFFSVGIVNQLNRYLELQKDKEQVELAIALQEDLQKQLQKELDFYDSDFYVEKIAREKLGLVKPDEKVFYNEAKK